MILHHRTKPVQDTTESDWAPMPNWKIDSPSRVSGAPDESSIRHLMEGVVVDTRKADNRDLLSYNESLTLTAVDEDDSIVEYAAETKTKAVLSSREEVNGKRQLVNDERDVENDENQNKANYQDLHGEDYDEVDERYAVESVHEKTEATAPRETALMSFFESYKPTEDQLQKVSEAATCVGAKAAEAGLQLSTLLRDGIQLGMAGVAKQLETMEQAVQRGLEENQRRSIEQPIEERRRRSPRKTKSQETQETEETQQKASEDREDETEEAQTEDEEERESFGASHLLEEAPSALAPQRHSFFEESTISSMGDTFQEYIKPRLMEQGRSPPAAVRLEDRDVKIPPKGRNSRRVMMSGKEQTKMGQNRAPTPVSKSSASKDKEGGRKGLSFGRNGSNKVAETKRSRSKTPVPMNGAGVATKRSNTPTKDMKGKDRVHSRGRQRSRSRSCSKPRSGSRTKSKRNTGATRSRFQKREEVARSRSRQRAKSLSRSQSTKRPEQTQKNASENKRPEPMRNTRAARSRSPEPRGQLATVPTRKPAEVQHAKAKKKAATGKVEPTKHETGPSNRQATTSWNDVVEKQAAKTKSNKKLAIDTQLGDGPDIQQSTSNSDKPHYESKVEGQEGIEMVPFTSKDGATGLLIINGGECAMSATPKDIQSKLQGKRSKRPPTTPTKAAPPGRNAVPGHSSSKGAFTKIAPPRSPVFAKRTPSPKTTTAVKKPLWGRRESPKAPVRSSKRPKDSIKNKKTKPDKEEELNEMIDAITNFKLTARKLGVAEQDLLEAMSFASRFDKGGDLDDDEYSDVSSSDDESTHDS